MIDATFVTTMARYNRWQNQSIYGAAETLNDEARRLDRGAFFGSIHQTLGHLLGSDGIWLSRFAGTPRPTPRNWDAADLVEWDELVAARTMLDGQILRWGESLPPGLLAGEITFVSGALGREVTRLVAPLVAHFFNHQTHHRGQVHAMLTAAGARPDDTDLMLLDERA